MKILFTAKIYIQLEIEQSPLYYLFDVDTIFHLYTYPKTVGEYAFESFITKTSSL